MRCPRGARTQLTFFPTASATATLAAPRRPTTSCSRKDIGGNEFAQIYRYDIATGDVTLLTDGGRSQNGLGAWSTRAIASPTARRAATAPTATST